MNAQKITRLGIQIVRNLTVQRSSCPHHFKGGMADFLDDSGLVSDYNMGEYERNLIFNMQEVDFKMLEIKEAHCVAAAFASPRRLFKRSPPNLPASTL